MWNTKDLCLVATLAAIGYVSAALIGQMGYILTGLRGVNSIFTLIFAIQTGFALLMYEGRRWRFFIQISIFTVLIIPTNYGSPAFDIIGKMSFMIAGFFTDIVACSVYQHFKKMQKIKYWTVLTGGLLFWSVQLTAGLAKNIFFYSSQAGIVFILIILSPLVVVESLIGSYMSYKIYDRIHNKKTTGTT